MPDHAPRPHGAPEVGRGHPPSGGGARRIVTRLHPRPLAERPAAPLGGRVPLRPSPDRNGAGHAASVGRGSPAGRDGWKIASDPWPA